MSFSHVMKSSFKPLVDSRYSLKSSSHLIISSAITRSPVLYTRTLPPTTLLVREILTTSKTKPATSGTKLRNLFLGTTGILLGAFFLEYYSDSRAAIHKYVLMPIIHSTLDAEQAHKLAVWSAKWGLIARDKVSDDERLAIEVWGKKISNPVGLAAGFDKNGEAVDGMFDLGFGYVEIGSITPEPQPGNPKPRVFRLDPDRAIINRYGFNSDGHYQVSTRLNQRICRYLHNSVKLRPEETAILLSTSSDGFASLSDALGTNRSLRKDRLLGINLGKNKTSPSDSVDDYVKGIKRLGKFADVLVVNISSPNTPGLRGLQRIGILERLLKEVIDARNSLNDPKPPLLVKIAPDLSDEELQDIAHAALHSGVDGLIVSNTTISRPEILDSDPPLTSETGGLSGPPLKPLALHALRELYKHTQGKLTLIGCGGITDAQDALEYARAGATLVQLYTSFGFDGVGKPREIKDGILRELKGKRWVDVIGEDRKYECKELCQA
ncbi:2219_t:CDS:2 [Ambispora gerdemannii]|uniref:Dihydroorotate dehydrogenase (quinone), mitochondrial n=1 Tax=Ambispora gerdemannii TaxID=144530 RepID=A0A9N9B2N9_9GLOM|nr:2219_t:CDS:2 [Ambispora gerdemannii]